MISLDFSREVEMKNEFLTLLLQLLRKENRNHTGTEVIIEAFKLLEIGCHQRTMLSAHFVWLSSLTALECAKIPCIIPNF